MSRVVSRSPALAGATLVALLAALVPLADGAASGPIWLPAQAAHLTSKQVALALATDRNHAYILSTRVAGSGGTMGVYVTTNESGAWTTRLLPAHGPESTLQDHTTALALDPSTRRLYAAWVYPSQPGREAVGVWTRAAAGTWSGPTIVATSASGFDGPPSIVAADGRAYVAFATGDVLVSAYDGTHWSVPQNLTGSVHGTLYDPKLALDGGHLYLVSANSTDSTWDLWYADNAGGTWSRPVQITHKRDNDLYHSDYSIAASQGSAYVAYTAYTGSGGGWSFGNHDIFLAVRPQGGPWTVGNVTKEPYNCDKYSPALVARAGRIGLAYVYGDVYVGSCVSTSGAAASGTGVHVLTGTPGHWLATRPGPGSDTGRAGVAVSSDGDLFRLAYSTPLDNAGAHSTDLYYKPEVLDVVGPTITRVAAPARASAPAITLGWSAQDPTPGAGVAYYDVQAREDTGAWQDLTPGGTRSTGLIYTRVRAGHRYTFRVRARDKVNNWGAWAAAGTQVA